MSSFALYVHIPFCLSKCKYCDFYSAVVKDIQQEEYFDALEKELLLVSENDIWKGRPLLSVYFGGGTPSLISPKYYKKFLGTVNNCFTFNDNIEITLEANPKTLSKKNLFEYKEAGINRISLGAQSFNDNILNFLGRSHTSNDTIQSVELIKESGVNNISLDFIYGIPNQKLCDVRNDLDIIKKLDITHVSFYSLIIEEKTVFGKMKTQGKIKECDDELFIKFDNEIINSLELCGFERYEISNYAKNQMYSKHNMAYWDYNDFLGIGAGAYSGFSKYNEDNLINSSVRYSNQRSFKKYIECIKNNQSAIIFYEDNDSKTAMFEYIMLSLRKLTGLNFDDFYQKFGKNFLNLYSDVIDKLKSNGLVDITSDNFSIKKNHILLSNSIIEEFL